MCQYIVECDGAYAAAETIVVNVSDVVAQFFVSDTTCCEKVETEIVLVDDALVVINGVVLKPFPIIGRAECA